MITKEQVIFVMRMLYEYDPDSAGDGHYYYPVPKGRADRWNHGGRENGQKRAEQALRLLQGLETVRNEKTLREAIIKYAPETTHVEFNIDDKTYKRKDVRYKIDLDADFSVVPKQLTLEFP